MGNNQNERPSFQTTHGQQRGSQGAAVSRVVAACAGHLGIPELLLWGRERAGRAGIGWWGNPWWFHIHQAASVTYL